MGTLHALRASRSDGDARELTLSERVAWVNSYERSIVDDEGAVVLELQVYPIETASTLPSTSFDRDLRSRLSRMLRGRKSEGRSVPRRTV